MRNTSEVRLLATVLPRLMACLMLHQQIAAWWMARMVLVKGWPREQLMAENGTSAWFGIKKNPGFCPSLAYPGYHIRRTLHQLSLPSGYPIRRIKQHTSDRRPIILSNHVSKECTSACQGNHTSGCHELSQESSGLRITQSYQVAWRSIFGCFIRLSRGLYVLGCQSMTSRTGWLGCYDIASSWEALRVRQS